MNAQVVIHSIFFRILSKLDPNQFFCPGAKPETRNTTLAYLGGFAELDADLLAAAVERAAGNAVLGRRLLHRHPALDRLQRRVQVILKVHNYLKKAVFWIRIRSDP